MENLTGLMVFGVGFGTVFVGLIALILLISLMSAVCRKLIKPEPAAPQKAAPAPAPAAAPAIADKGAFSAAVATAVAAVMEKDVEAIRIVSVKKVD